MKKILLILFGFAILLTGCSTQNSPEIQSVTAEEDTLTQAVQQEKNTNQTTTGKSMTPVEALVAENLLILGKDEIYPRKTELLAERIMPDDPKDSPWLKIFITEEGLPDDSVKNTTYEVHLKRQKDGSWKVTHQELLNIECRRGKTDAGCL
jgi:hypothetical protein